MPTRLYLRSESLGLSGTFPSGETDAQTANFTATGANTLRAMYGVKGSAQTSLNGATSATTSTQYGFMGFWASPPLDSGQTIGGGSETLTINVADFENTLDANFCVNRCHAYVWRPSTGVAVGDLCTTSTSVAGSPSEPTSANSIQVTSFNVLLSSVSASAGDVIVIELWTEITQASAGSYVARLYYDGSTETTVENTVVSDHAAFAEFSQTITFTAPEARLTQQSAIVFGESSATPEARLTQQSTIVFGESSTTPEARLTQQSIIVWHNGDASNSRTSTIRTESLTLATDSPARVSTLDAEILAIDANVPARVSTLDAEILAIDANVPARVSCIYVEVLSAFLPVNVRVSTIAAEFLCSNDDITKRSKCFVNT